MKKANLFLFFNHFEEEHLGKDVFLVPYYMGKCYNMNVSIVFPETKTNKNMPPLIRGVKLIPVCNIQKGKNQVLPFIFFLIRNIKNIDNLMLIHLVPPTALLGILYKIIKPTGFLYVKGDGVGMCSRDLEQRCMKSTQLKDKVIYKMFHSFLKKVNLITVETQKDYESLSERNVYGIDIKHKTKQMQNGFDDDLLSQFRMKALSFEEKEKIILTVGRLGTYPKNTEMLLEAIKRINLRDWKVVLIGPIEQKECCFQKQIDELYLNNPNLVDKVVFLNAIYDKKVLWEWYNKSKIFVMTSLSESFGIVYTEAARFKNYIISTDVGGARDIIEESWGEIINQEDYIALASALQKFIDNDAPLKTKFNELKETDFSWEKKILTSINIS